ncbi:hypothetical protein PSPO01_06647 [Paraphaeosphaeria sporulosa]
MQSVSIRTTTKSPIRSNSWERYTQMHQQSSRG